MKSGCYTPLTIRRKLTNESITVPCGKCPLCIARRISGWSFRLMQEDRVATSSYFITLTYDTKNIPITNGGYTTIRKRDLQLFFKRLRKSHSLKQQVYYGRECKPIKYYAVGEYGSSTHRPHYHVILFNARIELIQGAWDMGSVYYGKVSGASVGYTMKYMSKPKRLQRRQGDDRTPEFALMSKGLGKSYLTQEIVEWHLALLEDRMYVNLLDGRKVSMPRYYKDKIYSKEERKRIAFFTQIKRLADQEEWFNNPDHAMNERNKAERIKAAFEKMDYQYYQTQSKI